MYLYYKKYGMQQTVVIGLLSRFAPVANITLGENRLLSSLVYYFGLGTVDLNSDLNKIKQHEKMRSFYGDRDHETTARKIKKRGRFN